MLENPQILFRKHETKAKLSSHEMVTLTKAFHTWRKVLDFPFAANLQSVEV